VETQALSLENCVLRLPPEEPLSQLSAECQIKALCNSEVWLTSIISLHMLESLCRSGHTYTHSRRKFRHEWHLTSDWSVSVGEIPSKL